MQFNDGCGQVQYIGHSIVKKVIDNFYSFLYAEAQIEQTEMMQSFIGLAGLIFEINGKNWQFITIFAIKTTHTDAVMLRIRCLCTVHAWYFGDHTCALFKMLHIIWICIQVHTNWVHSLFSSALIFEADDGNPLNWPKLILALSFSVCPSYYVLFWVSSLIPFLVLLKKKSLPFNFPFLFITFYNLTLLFKASQIFTLSPLLTPSPFSSLSLPLPHLPYLLSYVPFLTFPVFSYFSLCPLFTSHPGERILSTKDHTLLNCCLKVYTMLCNIWTYQLLCKKSTQLV